MHSAQHVAREFLVPIYHAPKMLIAVVETLPGRLGIRAFASGGSLGADFNLVLQVVMGVALIIGALLARAKRYTAHGICQTAVLLLNSAIIGGLMWPSFSSRVLPVLPHHLADSYYSVASAHGVVAVAAQVFGLYLMLVAATDFLPNRLRLQRLKRWMRIELGLWWIAIASGVLTYYFWYMANP